MAETSLDLARDLKVDLAGKGLGDAEVHLLDVLLNDDLVMQVLDI